MKGMFWGVAIGVGAGLLMAPAPGSVTRERIQERTEEWRQRAMQTAEQAKAKAEELQERGRDMINENTTRLTRTAEAVKRTAEETWNQPVNEPPMATGNNGVPAKQPATTTSTVPGRVP